VSKRPIERVHEALVASLPEGFTARIGDDVVEVRSDDLVLLAAAIISSREWYTSRTYSTGRRKGGYSGAGWTDRMARDIADELRKV
jgi:hypothetical protein